MGARRVKVTNLAKLTCFTFFTLHTSTSTCSVFITRHANITESIVAACIAFEAVVLLEFINAGAFVSGCGTITISLGAAIRGRERKLAAVKAVVLKVTVHVKRKTRDERGERKTKRKQNKRIIWI